jgi:hypothetical protein
MSARTAAVLVSAIAVTGVLAGAQIQAPPSPRPPIAQSVRDRVLQTGRARVIVELNVRSAPEGGLASAPAVLRQRQGIADARARMLLRLPAFAQRVIHRYQTVPFVAPVRKRHPGRSFRRLARRRADRGMPGTS